MVSSSGDVLENMDVRHKSIKKNIEVFFIVSINENNSSKPLRNSKCSSRRKGKQKEIITIIKWQQSACVFLNIFSKT